MNQAWIIYPILAICFGIWALAPLGVQVLERGVVFMDLAVAQTAAVGSLAVLALISDHPTWFFTQCAATAGALVAVFLVSQLARIWPAQREALIGLIYVTSACLALLLARLNVHGAEHLQELLAADLLWASEKQVVTLAFCAAATALLKRHWAVDRWFYICFAVTTSLAVQTLGLFVVFAALIAPGLWHRKGLTERFSVWLALLSAGCGLAFSWLVDIPSGAAIALTLAFCGMGAVLIKNRNKQ